MLIPIHFRYTYQEYKFSPRATKYSRLQGMSRLIGGLVGFFSFLILVIPLMLWMNSDAGAWVAIALAVVGGVLFTVWFRKAMGKKVESALREDLEKLETEPMEEAPAEAEAQPVPDYDLWLVCDGGYMNGRVYPITADRPVTIGRLPTNLLRYPENYPGVSREHARLAWEGGRLMLTDLNSTEGTVIFGKGQLAPMTPQEVVPGDVFYVGEEKNAFEIKN